MKPKSLRFLPIRHCLLSKTLTLSFGLAVAGLSIQSAKADNTWDGGGASGSWSDLLNWGSDTTPVSPTALTFAGALQLTNTNDLFAADTAFNGITFSSTSGAFVIGGTGITLGGDILNGSTTAQTINLDMALSANRLVRGTVSGAGAITLGGIISGAQALQVGTSTTASAFGNVILTGANTFSGGLAINNGRVSVTLIGDNGSASPVGTGVVTLGGSGANGSLRYTGTGETNNRTINLSSGNAASSATIEQNGASGTLTLTGAITNSVVNKPLTLQGTGAGVISGAIADGTTTLNLTKAAAGTWTLSGANTYDGTTTVSAGTLAGIGANAFGSTTGISIAAAGTLSLRGDADTSFVKVSDSSAYPVATSASGATVNADQATVAGTGAKTMTIGTIGTTSTNVAYSINFTGANSTGLTAGAVTGPATIAAGVVTLSNTNLTGTTTLASYTSANTTGGETLRFTGAGNTTINGAITPGAISLGLQKFNIGTLTLNAASTFTGNVDFKNDSNDTGVGIGAGTILVTNGSALGSGSVVMSGNDGNDARLQLANNITIANPVSLGGQAAAGATARIENLSGANEISGSINYAQTGGGFINLVSTAGTLTLSGTISNIINSTAATRTLVFSGAGDTLVSGNIVNNTATGNQTIALLKDGTGKLTLSGTNTYTGATNVNAGRLHVTGSLTSAVTANSTATLSGTGSITGNAHVTSGGHFASAIATSPGAQVPLAITGTLTVDSGNILDLTAAATPAAGVYKLATATGGVTYTAGTVNLSGVAGTVSVSLDGKDLILTATGGGGSAYGTWASSKSLTGSNNGATQDPDSDGIANELEFVLGGNPLASDTAKLPVLTTDATHFIFTFSRADESEAEIGLTFEWGSTLTGWTPVTIGATTLTSGAGVTVTEDSPSATVDTVEVRIPKASAVNGKLFGRLKSVK